MGRGREGFYSCADLDAAQNVALSIGQRLALLLCDELGNLALVGAEQVLEAEKRRLARDDGGLGDDVFERLVVEEGCLFVQQYAYEREEDFVGVS